MRKFWYVAVITLVIGTPIILSQDFGNYRVAAYLHPPGIVQALRLVGLFVSLVLLAAKTAAILGLLTADRLENKVWKAVRSCVKIYTWTLFRLNILIGLIAILVAIPFGLVMRVTGSSANITLFVTGLYLVLVKYALADPLVVVENLNARDALYRSWEMTKGHFWYVAGCYLFLGFGEWLIHKLMGPSLNGTDRGSVWILVQLGLRTIDSLWIFLSWCMYQRIKEADAIAPVHGIPSTESPPESPSASQTA